MSADDSLDTILKDVEKFSSQQFFSDRELLENLFLICDRLFFSIEKMYEPFYRGNVFNDSKNAFEMVTRYVYEIVKEKYVFAAKKVNFNSTLLQIRKHRKEYKVTERYILDYFGLDNKNIEDNHALQTLAFILKEWQDFCATSRKNQQENSDKGIYLGQLIRPSAFRFRTKEDVLYKAAVLFIRTSVINEFGNSLTDKVRNAVELEYLASRLCWYTNSIIYELYAERVDRYLDSHGAYLAAFDYLSGKIKEIPGNISDDKIDILKYAYIYFISMRYFDYNVYRQFLKYERPFSAISGAEDEPDQINKLVQKITFFISMPEGFYDSIGANSILHGWPETIDCTLIEDFLRHNHLLAEKIVFCFPDGLVKKIPSDRAKKKAFLDDIPRFIVFIDLYKKMFKKQSQDAIYISEMFSLIVLYERLKYCHIKVPVFDGYKSSSKDKNISILGVIKNIEEEKQPKTDKNRRQRLRIKNLVAESFLYPLMEWIVYKRPQTIIPAEGKKDTEDIAAYFRMKRSQTEIELYKALLNSMSEIKMTKSAETQLQVTVKKILEDS